MEHSFTLISTLAAGFGIALVFGFIAEKFKIPALVGYLLAGVIVSPATPGFVADINIASQLSEIGVMLLMFGVGLHFSLSDLMRVKYIAVPGAVAQMGLATGLGLLVAHYWGWTYGQSLVFGLCLSCASTVVLLKALETKGILESHDGQIAVGWLVVEDIMTVLILVLLPPLAPMLGAEAVQSVESATPLWEIIAWTVGRVALFIFLMLVVGKRVLPWLLWQVAKTGSRELFTLCVLAVAIGIAYGASEVFSVSFALGAFFSGMVMRESKYAHRAAMESLPLRDAFSVIFFVGVGMMFDPMILVDKPLHLLAVLAIIILGKSLVAFGLVMLFRYPLHTALTVAASLAQIGEFSFILAGLGVSLGLLPQEGMSLVLAGAIISIAFNPVAFALVEPLKNLMKKRWKYARVLDAKSDPLSVMPDEEESKYLRGHMVLVGYNKVCEHIAKDLSERKVPFVIVEKDRNIVEDLRENGFKAVCGDAIDPAILIQAHVQDAAMVILNFRDDILRRKVIETAKILNHKIEAVIMTSDDEIAVRAMTDHLGKVFDSNAVMAGSIVKYCMHRLGKAEEEKKFEEESEAEVAK
ncbi:cation:proton antiporter domain-containing protein [Turicimonas muris]|uniref:Sodium:proton antiporter n=25 Tax=Turicimonas muris TaxID=1796652 RepID=A0A227KDN8_9BURK|nr:cation:proton antiporter [Turicimonas muris]ANU65673.1 sodium:proton antiporter [Burkholderiales bacterium YL45]OXE45515.1 sodium:proton antiporter [Turicimonas muris]QQQ96820.1 cation:proton antiporter [Turicimonas muris]